jgi:hypothetical protein
MGDNDPHLAHRNDDFLLIIDDDANKERIADAL